MFNQNLSHYQPSVIIGTVSLQTILSPNQPQPSQNPPPESNHQNENEDDLNSNDDNSTPFQTHVPHTNPLITPFNRISSSQLNIRSPPPNPSIARHSTYSQVLPTSLHPNLITPSSTAPQGENNNDTISANSSRQPHIYFKAPLLSGNFGVIKPPPPSSAKMSKHEDITPKSSFPRLYDGIYTNQQTQFTTPSQSNFFPTNVCDNEGIHPKASENASRQELSDLENHDRTHYNSTYHSSVRMKARLRTFAFETSSDTDETPPLHTTRHNCDTSQESGHFTAITRQNTMLNSKSTMFHINPNLNTIEKSDLEEDLSQSTTTTDALFHDNNGSISSDNSDFVDDSPYFWSKHPFSLQHPQSTNELTNTPSTQAKPNILHNLNPSDRISLRENAPNVSQGCPTRNKRGRNPNDRVVSCRYDDYTDHDDHDDENGACNDTHSHIVSIDKKSATNQKNNTNTPRTDNNTNHLNPFVYLPQYPHETDTNRSLLAPLLSGLRSNLAEKPNGGEQSDISSKNRFKSLKLNEASDDTPDVPVFLNPTKVLSSHSLPSLPNPTHPGCTGTVPPNSRLNSSNLVNTDKPEPNTSKNGRKSNSNPLSAGICSFNNFSRLNIQDPSGTNGNTLGGHPDCIILPTNPPLLKPSLNSNPSNFSDFSRSSGTSRSNPSASVAFSNTSPSPRHHRRTLQTTGLTTGGSFTATSRGHAFNTFFIVAISEFRSGRTVGISAINLHNPEIILSQYVDSQTYTTTMQMLHYFEPQIILFPEGATGSAALQSVIQQNNQYSEHFSQNVLKTLIQREMPNIDVVTIKRRFFNEEDGLSYLDCLCLPQYLHNIQFGAEKYLCLASTGCLLKYIEHTQQILWSPQSLRVSFKPPEGNMAIDLNTIKALELVHFNGFLKVPKAANSHATRDLGFNLPMMGDNLDPDIHRYGLTIGGKKKKTRVKKGTNNHQIRNTMGLKSDMIVSSSLIQPHNIPKINHNADSFAQNNINNYNNHQQQYQTLLQPTKQTLFNVLNYTKTRGGARTLRHCLLNPFYDYASIQSRLQCVEALVGNEEFFFSLTHSLPFFAQIEVLCSQLTRTQHLAHTENTSTNPATAQNQVLQVTQLRNILRNVPQVQDICQKFAENIANVQSQDQSIFGIIANHLISPIPAHLIEQIDTFINPNNNLVIKPVTALSPQHHAQQSLIATIHPGINSKLDILRGEYQLLFESLQQRVIDICTTYNLPQQYVKLSYTLQRGYHLTISSPFQGNRQSPENSILPPSQLVDIFIQRAYKKSNMTCTTLQLQTISQRLMQYYNDILFLTLASLQSLFQTIRQQMLWLYLLCDHIALLDVLLSFATFISLTPGLCKPMLTANGGVLIKNGKHPLHLTNPQHLGSDVWCTPSQPLLVLTGPNNSGKSTYLRKVAMIIILSHIGCFVPADYCTLPVFHNIVSCFATNTTKNGFSFTSSYSLAANNTLYPFASKDNDDDDHNSPQSNMNGTLSSGESTSSFFNEMKQCAHIMAILDSNQQKYVSALQISADFGTSSCGETEPAVSTRRMNTNTDESVARHKQLPTATIFSPITPQSVQTIATTPPKTFVLIDEVGRSTLHSNGVAIAWSLIERMINANHTTTSPNTSIVKGIQQYDAFSPFPMITTHYNPILQPTTCYGIIATHYEELTRLPLYYNCVKNICVDVKIIQTQKTPHNMISSTENSEKILPNASNIKNSGKSAYNSSQRKNRKTSNIDDTDNFSGGGHDSEDEMLLNDEDRTDSGDDGDKVTINHHSFDFLLSQQYHSLYNIIESHTFSHNQSSPSIEEAFHSNVINCNHYGLTVANMVGFPPDLITHAFQLHSKFTPSGQSLDCDSTALLASHSIPFWAYPLLKQSNFVETAMSLNARTSTAARSFDSTTSTLLALDDIDDDKNDSCATDVPINQVLPYPIPTNPQEERHQLALYSLLGKLKMMPLLLPNIRQNSHLRDTSPKTTTTTSSLTSTDTLIDDLSPITPSVLNMIVNLLLTFSHDFHSAIKG